MTGRIYRTARGKQVDMGALQLKNENTRAVSNMAVNARGDLIDSNNKVIDKRNERAKRQYNLQSNVTHVPPSMRPQASTASVAKPTTTPVTTPTPTTDTTVAPVAQAPQPVAQPELTGLAAAIARAKQNNDTQQ